jgi:hypothetical protein
MNLVDVYGPLEAQMRVCCGNKEGCVLGTQDSKLHYKDVYCFISLFKSCLTSFSGIYFALIFRQYNRLMLKLFLV